MGLVSPCSTCLPQTKSLAPGNTTATEQLCKYTIYCWLLPVGRELNIRDSQLQNNPIYVLGIDMKNPGFTPRKPEEEALLLCPAPNMTQQWPPKSSLQAVLQPCLCHPLCHSSLAPLLLFTHLQHPLLITHTHTHSKQHPFPVKPLFPHHSCSPALAGVLVAVSGVFWGGLHKDQRTQAMELKRAIREKISKERVLCLNLCTFPSFIPPSATSLLWSLLLHKPTHHYSCLHTITSNNNNS